MVTLINGKPIARRINKRLIGAKYNYLEVLPEDIIKTHFRITPSRKWQTTNPKARRFYFCIGDNEVGKIYIYQLKITPSYSGYSKDSYYIREFFVDPSSIDAVIPSEITFTLRSKNTTYVSKVKHRKAIRDRRTYNKGMYQKLRDDCF